MGVWGRICEVGCGENLVRMLIFKMFKLLLYINWCMWVMI